jgi:hypothetical protein
MRKTVYISILLLSFFSAAQAQKKFIYEDTSLLQKEEQVINAPEEEVTYMDTAVVSVPVEESEELPSDTSLYKNDLNFPFDSIKSWRNANEFAYTRYLDSLLKSKKKQEKKERSQTSEPSRPGTFNSILGSGILGFLLWTFVICFVGFILYQLFLSEGGFRRKSKSVKDTLAEAEEEVITKESDFDALIRQALQSGNYRQAIRYQYLRTLHLLAGKNQVELAPDKTNFQYVSEITNPDHRQAFAALTLNYEYVWYGEFEIDKNIYEKIEDNFRYLNQKI